MLVLYGIKGKKIKLATLIFTIGVMLILPSVCSADNTDKENESFYTLTKRCVIRLEHFVEYLEEGSEKPNKKSISDGTAFFVDYKNILYIVSARHVVEKDYDLHARVPVIYKPKKQNEDKELEGREDVVLLKLPRKGWIYHINGGDNTHRYVDIAVMKIGRIKDRGIVHFIYIEKENPNYDKNQLPEKDPIPPEEVMTFGFPLDIGFELKEQRPFGRRGMISLVSDVDFIKDANGKHFDKRCFIMDVESFPGNSGSPVINTPSPFKTGLKLFGLIIASNERQDFSIAEPVSRIREVIETADKDTREPYKVWYTYNSESQ